MRSLSIPVREDAVVPLDRWLATELTQALKRPVPRGLTRKAIVGGLVTVGGRIARQPQLMLARGPSVFVRSFDWLPRQEAASPLKILYEDEWLIAVDKPAGLATHETKDVHRLSLTQLLEARVGKRLFVHHRLDAGTSGVMLFAKAAEANAALARSFGGRRVDKTYLALIHRPPIDWPTEMPIHTPILVASNGTVRVDDHGVPAATIVRVLDRRPHHLLVEAKTLTGRKHQIRVHLASVGAPIVGDSRYGRPNPLGARLMLHAERIELEHPVTGLKLSIKSPRPAEFQPAMAGEWKKGRAPTVPRSSRPHRHGADPRSATPESHPRTSAGPGPRTPSHKGRTRRRPETAPERGSRR